MAKKKTTPSEVATPAKTTDYTVLARRYRPQQFGDLVGQESVAQALVNALKSNRVAHAYLFTGTRGVGKTSTARILAKALNCVKGPTPTPCDQCESCQAIAVGEDVDVIEIDGASNNKVEEIRELRQNVGFRPSRSRYKIYVIDEVHMLTTSAFNALLKTLEEPPAHVKFIFATTDLHKIPITILSRCQRFDFIGIGADGILERLKEIVASEGMAADDEALTIIARRAAGSMRDAQSLLDQVLAFGDDKVTAKMVQQLLGTADEDLVASLASAVLERDVARALELLHQGLEKGVVLGELVDQLVEYWRDLMLLKAAAPNAKQLNFAPRFHDAMRRQAGGMSLEGILAGLDVLAATKTRLRDAHHPRVLVEMLIVRLGRMEDLMSVADLAQQLTHKSISSGPVTSAPTARAEPAATFAALKKNSPLSEPASQEANDAPVAMHQFDTASLPELWQAMLGDLNTSMSGRRIVEDLKKHNNLAISAPNCLVIRFPSAYTREKQGCEEPERLNRIEDSLKRLTGQTVSARFELAQGDSEPVPPVAKPVSRVHQQRKDAWQEPLVRRAMEALGASLIRLDEGFGAVAEPVNQQAEVDGTDV